MNDFSSILDNPSMHATALQFVPIPVQRLSKEKFGGEVIESGARIQANGDVKFCIYAPTAESVKIEVRMLAAKKFQQQVNYDREILCPRGHKDEHETIELVKDERGCFNGILPWSSLNCGYQQLKVFVDGVFVVEPHMAVSYGAGFANFVEVPDPDMEYILVKDVPHGSVTIDTYWSEVMNQWVRQFVYTPPGYRQSDEKYPVVYLHQGRTESETGWTFSGKVPQIMDNLIADGRAVPAIVVMNDGMYRTPEDEELKYDGFINMILEDTIPYVEANYRCICDKWHRALAGLSMGGMQASQGGLGHPETFAWLGLFSCSIRPRDTQEDYDKNLYLNILKDKERAEAEFKLIYRANGLGELMRDITILEDDDWIEKNNIPELSCYRRSIIKECGGEHDWSTFRRAFRDFMGLAFKN